MARCTLQKTVAICGAGHSGSTLLGLILDSHSACFYAGEGAKIRYLDDTTKVLRKRVCKLCGEGCRIWSSFAWRQADPLYVQIAEHVDRAVIVDSTKNPSWIQSRTAELEGTGAVPHLIFLLRDGRAVINSRLRKYPDRDAEAQIDQWVDQIERSQELFDAFEGPKLVLRYEALATEPERVVRQLTNFLGLPSEPNMVSFGQFEHHPLGGNNGTQYLAARRLFSEPEAAFVSVGERSRDYYEKHVGGIALDLRWMTEMRDEHLALFERVAGDFNRPMRWGMSDVQS